jgi:hypothetical protein
MGGRYGEVRILGERRTHSRSETRRRSNGAEDGVTYPDCMMTHISRLHDDKSIVGVTVRGPRHSCWDGKAVNAGPIVHHGGELVAQRVLRCRRTGGGFSGGGITGGECVDGSVK